MCTLRSTALSHHASQRDERTLNLCVVDVLEQIVGLEDVVWLQAILRDGTNKISYVFQLRKRSGCKVESGEKVSQ